MAGMLDNLKDVKQELDKCMKCGNCMAVCPVYLTEKIEAGVARGKLSLAEAIISGDIDIKDKDTVNRLSDCLICKSCMQNCPCGVKFDRIMFSLRAAIARENGLHPLKKIIFATIKNQKLFDFGLRLGGVFQPIIFRPATKDNAFQPRFSIGLDLKRVLPKINSVPFRNQVNEVIKPEKPAKIRAAFFTGCSINYMFPQVGHSVVSVLRNNSVEVIVPKDQQCCGIAVFAHGDVDNARVLARKNIDVFEKTKADYIITACGSCGGSWQHEFKELLADDPAYATKAEYWSKRTFDISTFLTKIINYRKPKGHIEKTITFHDSCHLKKTMGVFTEPREILKAIPGVTLQEMKKPDSCCGGGGSYSLTHYDTSIAITKRKIFDINHTNAQEIITGCPGCVIQIMDGVSQFGENQEVNHYITLLAKSYEKEKESKKDVEHVIGTTEKRAS